MNLRLRGTSIHDVHCGKNKIYSEEFADRLDDSRYGVNIFYDEMSDFIFSKRLHEQDQLTFGLKEKWKKMTEYRGPVLGREDQR
jgi:hypothetical protein